MGRDALTAVLSRLRLLLLQWLRRRRHRHLHWHLYLQHLPWLYASGHPDADKLAANVCVKDLPCRHAARHLDHERAHLDLHGDRDALPGTPSGLPSWALSLALYLYNYSSTLL